MDADLLLKNAAGLIISFRMNLCRGLIFLSGMVQAASPSGSRLIC
jgi:hypothetical protein